MLSANGGLPAHRYTPQVTPRWPRGSEPASICFCESAWWVTLWVVHRVWHKVWRGRVLYELGGFLLRLCVAVRQLRAAIH